MTTIYMHYHQPPQFSVILVNLCSIYFMLGNINIDFICRTSYDIGSFMCDYAKTADHMFSKFCQCMGNGKFLTWWRHHVEIFPRYWPFVRGIHRSLVNSPHRGQWRGSLMFSFICGLNKQSSGWWFETLSRSLWRHCNELHHRSMAKIKEPKYRYDIFERLFFSFLTSN